MDEWYEWYEDDEIDPGLWACPSCGRQTNSGEPCRDCQADQGCRDAEAEYDAVVMAWKMVKVVMCYDEC